MRAISVFVFLALSLCQKNDLRSTKSNTKKEHLTYYVLIDSLISPKERLTIRVFWDNVVVATSMNGKKKEVVLNKLPLRYSLSRWKGIITNNLQGNLLTNNFLLIGDSFAFFSIEDDQNRGVFIPIFKDKLGFWNTFDQHESYSFLVVNQWPLFVETQKRIVMTVTPSFNLDDPDQIITIYEIKSNHLMPSKTLKLHEPIMGNTSKDYSKLFELLK